MLLKYFKICVLSLVLFFAVINCTDKVFQKELPQILGINYVQIEASSSTDQFGGFGEGYTLETYKVSKKTIEEFLSNSSKILPEKREKNKNWQKKDWNKLPIDSSYEEVLSVGLNYLSGNTEIDNEIQEIKKFLNTGEVYYALYFSPDKDNPQDVQIFIFNIESMKLYIIESNI